MSAERDEEKGGAVSWVLLLSLALFLSKVLGFFKETFLAKYFGATAVVDAYKVAILVPQVAAALFVTGMGIVFVPIYAEYIAAKRERAAWEMVRTLARWLILFLMILTLLGELGAPAIVKAIAPGFLQGKHLELGTYPLAVKLLRIVLPYFFFSELGGFAQAILQANRRFLFIVLWQLFPNLLLAGVLVGFQARYGIVPLAGAYLLVGVGYFFFLGSGVLSYARGRRKSLEAVGGSDVREEGYAGAQKVIRWTFPVICTASVVQLVPVIDRFLASSLGSGSIAVLDYAFRLFLFPVTIVMTAFSFVIYPSFSYRAQEEKEAFQKVVSQAVRAVIFLGIPLLLLFSTLSLPMVRLVYERGSFHPEDTLKTAEVLRAYALGMVSWGLLEVLNRAFYSLGEVKIPLILSSASSLVNIVGSILLSRLVGVWGLALASAVGVSFNAALALFWFQNKKNIPLLPGSRGSLIQLALAALTAFFVSIPSQLFFESPLFLGSLEGRALALFCQVSVEILVYFGTAALLRNRDFLLFLDIFQQLLARVGARLNGSGKGSL